MNGNSEMNARGSSSIVRYINTSVRMTKNATHIYQQRSTQTDANWPNMNNHWQTMPMLTDLKDRLQTTNRIAADEGRNTKTIIQA